MTQSKLTSQRDEQHWSALMTQAQAGDSDAYNQLLSELAEAIEAYIKVNFGALPILEDCVQECLIAIHTARHTYNTKRLFRPWLFTVVRHKTIDMIRHADTVKLENLGDFEGVSMGLVNMSSIERLMDGSILLKKLSEEQRQAITLTKYYGMTSAEAAMLIGVKESTFKARLRRGLKQIEQLWKNEWEMI